jgi:hypothetical protein
VPPPPHAGKVAAPPNASDRACVRAGDLDASVSDHRAFNVRLGEFPSHFLGVTLGRSRLSTTPRAETDASPPPVRARDATPHDVQAARR